MLMAQACNMIETYMCTWQLSSEHLNTYQLQFERWSSHTECDTHKHGYINMIFEYSKV